MFKTCHSCKLSRNCFETSAYKNVPFLHYVCTLSRLYLNVPYGVQFSNDLKLWSVNEGYLSIKKSLTKHLDLTIFCISLFLSIYLSLSQQIDQNIFIEFKCKSSEWHLYLFELFHNFYICCKNDVL